MRVYTIGHSTRSITEFIRILSAYDVDIVADVRRFPGSRRLPQFSESSLAGSLAACGIGYWWIPALGGRRRPAEDSPNIAWTHPAFRAYADHIATEEFADGLFELLMIAQGAPTVIMCAEVLWWRCHRRLIADVLTSLGCEVVHIRDTEHSEVHKLRAPGRVHTGILRYDAIAAPRGRP